MEEMLYSVVEGTQEGMSSNNWNINQQPLIINNFASHQQQCSTDISSVLGKVLDEKHIEQSLSPTKRSSNQKERNEAADKDRKRRNSTAQTSLYRGVIKCNDHRFEAYVLNNSNQAGKGKIVYVGAYSAEADAAKAHDLVSIKIRGLKAETNFPVKSYFKEMEELQRTNTRDYISTIRRRGKGILDGDSPYRGVYRVPASRKWEARLGREGSITLHLGTYYTVEDAARAFDIISIKLKRGDAITNFDMKTYQLNGIMERVITQATDGSIILQKEGSNTETQANSRWGSLVQALQLSNSSICLCCKNHHLISTNPYTLGGFTGVAGNCGNGNSVVNHAAQTAAQFPNQRDTLQQPLQNRNVVNVNNGFNQSILNNNNWFLPRSSNLPTQSQVNVNLNFNQNLINNNQSPSLSSNLQTKSQVNVNNNFNQNLLHNNNNNQLLPQSSNLQSLNQVNVNNSFNQNLPSNNKQFLPQTSNLQTQSPVNDINNFSQNLVHNINQFLPQSSNLIGHFPDWPSDFGKKLLGGNLDVEPLINTSTLIEKPPSQVKVNQNTGATNGVSSFRSQIQSVQEQQIGATQLQLPEVNQRYEPYKVQDNAFNYISNENLNSSDSFHSPGSEPNSHGSHSLTTGSQIDVEMSHFLNKSFIEDSDFPTDFDFFTATTGGRQGFQYC